ncbi:zinc finger BED domain-containing protein RICESLEEPER 2 [Tanacetum coccineum]|uniref:Zinc finger BED domain-containing protein RICESLEEPER 2 n=1 Tax=Tanacetum coccineum TaxID=301880 RepID=A0ABQ4Z5P7_9ASTR
MASESASTTTGAGSTSALAIREIIPTNRTPEVWKDFNMCIMTNGHKKAQCKYCFHFFSEGSNTTLKNHITHPHCEVLKAQQNQNPEAGQTSMGRDGQIFMYNPDYLREQFASLVIQEGWGGLPIQPFDRADNEVFQKHLQTKIHSSALNPCFNVSGVDYLIENISRDLEFQDDGFATRSLDWFHESFQGLYNMYYTKYGTNHTQSTSGGGSSSGVSRDPYARLLHGLKGHTKKKARNDPTMSSEYEQYLKADFVSHLHPKDFATFDVLGFWKAKENQFPVLSRMAMDILSVQASSVASESAFSTSGRLLTIRRTRLTPESLEMCMCLKDHLDAQERKQDTSPLELPLDVEEGVFNVEVQQNEATQLTDQEIALDASSDGSSGEPRHDYMMSSGAEDDQTGDGHDGSMSHGYY